MIQFELNGVEYRAHPIPALVQLRLVMKLAPAIPALAPALMAAFKGDIVKGIASGDLSVMVDAVTPLADVLSKMPDEHVDFIISTALSALLRKDGDKWSQIAPKGQLMFDDISGPTIMHLVIRVLRENLTGFIPGLAMSQTASPTSP